MTNMMFDETPLIIVGDFNYTTPYGMLNTLTIYLALSSTSL